MITRDDALALLAASKPEPHLLHHALETEAIMRGLARRLGRDEELWGLTGLLHDLDFPRTKDTPERHGLEAMAALEGKLPAEALHAIRAHNGERTGTAPETELDYALRSAETVTGRVAANALVRPTKMVGMKPKSLKKKMKETLKTVTIPTIKDQIAGMIKKKKLKMMMKNKMKKSTMVNQIMKKRGKMLA